MSKWFALFWKRHAPTSVGGLILEMRKLRHSVLYMSMAVIVLTAAIYLQFIYPVFLPDTIANPAVVNFMTSESFRKTAPFFSDLNRYNERRPEESVSRPAEFLAIDPSQFGLVVALMYHLIRHDGNSPIGEVDGHKSAEPGYSYVPDISVRPALPILIGFLSLELVLILWVIALFRQKQPPAQLEFEDHVLREYFAIDSQENIENMDASNVVCRGMQPNSLKDEQTMDAKLEAAQDWLVRDQYSHGEWGRCESSDPTADVRNFEISKIKPNLFISSQAALALESTGFKDPNVVARFFAWLESLRDPESGFWTSASGAQIPMGGVRGWSEVKNVRHTAKVLDMYLLKGCFTAGDAAVLHQLLEYQANDGAFPQHPSGASDLWSTAYAMNLLIRATNQDHLIKTVPRGRKPADWAVELRNRNDKARAWLCSQMTNGLWSMNGKDDIWISEAVLAEVGADLALRRPDVAAQVATSIWCEPSASRRGQTMWAMLLVLDTLSPDVRSEVEAALSAWQDLAIVANTYDMACSVRAFWFKDKPALAREMLDGCNGHESLMTRWEAWPDGVVVPREQRTAVNQSLKVDLAIIAIRDDEFEAVLKYFDPNREIRGKRRTYSVAEVTSSSGMRYQIALLRAHEQGHAAAQSAASDVLADLEPAWLLLVGIAGAVPETEYCLGDVVVASRIVDFSVSAALADGSTELAARGGPAHKAAQDVASRLPALRRKLGDWNSEDRLGMVRPIAPIDADKLVGDDDWNRKIRSALVKAFGETGHEICRPPLVTSAPIASANMLVKAPSVLQGWLEHARDIKAIEMELPGVYEAARDQAGDHPVMAIRGISDIVGYKRSPEWTEYACLTAASLAHALVSADAFPLD